MSRTRVSDDRREGPEGRKARTRRWAAIAMVGAVAAAPLTAAATGDDDGGPSDAAAESTPASSTTHLEAVAEKRAEMLSKFELLAEDASALAERAAAAEQQRLEEELKRIAAEREEQKRLEEELKRIAAEREEQKRLEEEQKRIAAEKAAEERRAAEAAAAAAAPAPAPAPAPAVAAGSVWDRLAQCESGGNWAINTGNGYYGGLQFSLSSWRAVGGTGMPHQASREHQIAMGEKLKSVQGWGAWPACSRKLGLR